MLNSDQKEQVVEINNDGVENATQITQMDVSTNELGGRSPIQSKMRKYEDELN